MDYATWRMQLHELQQEFDKFEEEFWDNDPDATYENYAEARKPFADKLQKHYDLESTTK